MAENEGLQRALSHNLVKLIKLTDLGAIFKGPEVMFIISKKFNRLYKDGILHLEQLYQDMAEVEGVDRADLQGLFLYFKNQEESLGVRMQMPADLMLLPQAKRDAAYQKIADQIAARLPKGPAGKEATPDKPAAAGKIAFKAVGKPSKFRNIGLIVVAVLGLASLLLNLQQSQPPKPDLSKVELDLNAYQLSGELVRKQGSFVLKIPIDAWEKMSRDDQRTRVLALAKGLVPEGMRNLMIMDPGYETLAVASADLKIVFLSRKDKQ